jgi:hypothetical protein
MYLHLEEASLQLKLCHIALAVGVQGTEGIHDVEVCTRLIKMILLVLYDFQGVQDVCQKTIEGRVLLLLFLKTHTQIIPHRFKLALVICEPFRSGISLQKLFIINFEPWRDFLIELTFLGISDLL